MCYKILSGIFSMNCS